MSRDPCTRIRDRFSDLLERRVDDDGAAEIARHLDACEACRFEWASFERAVETLRGHEVQPASPRDVEQLLAAVDLEARRAAGPSDDEDLRRDAFRRAMLGERSPRRNASRPVLTHAAAVAAGVAAAALLLPWLGWLGLDRTPDASVPADAEVRAPTSRTAPPVRLALADGRGRLLRDGRPVEAAASSSVEPRPGDVLEIDPGAGLLLALGDAGTVRIEARPAEPPPPRVVERTVPVERVRYVARGPLVSIDGEAFEHAVGRFEGLVRSVGTQVSDLAARSAAAPRPTPEPAAEVSPDVVEVAPPAPSTLVPEAPRPSAPEVARAPRRVESVRPSVSGGGVVAPAPRPVLVRRNGDRVRIETRGAPYEVIPELIAHLDSDDPDVAEGARLRLEEIVESLDPGLAARLDDPGAAPEDDGALAFVKGLLGRETPPAPRSETESWQTWWERNAVHILEAGTWGTF